MRNALHSIAATAVAVGTFVGSAHAAPHATKHFDWRSSKKPATVAILGDAPYGLSQAQNVDALISAINAEEVDMVVHLGDIKAGSVPCSDAYFDFVHGAFERFEAPLFYVPGDNEWTDCHRENNGDYNPVERLATLRDVFFDRPGASFGGRHRRVATQAYAGYPENQTWSEAGVQVGLVHIVGSNNGLAPWALGPNDEDLPELRMSEVEERTDAAIAWLERIFAQAGRSRAAGVLLVWHADMWAPYEHSNGLDMSGFTSIVERLNELATAFGKPVLVVNGDSHDFYRWKPLSDVDTHPSAPYYTGGAQDLSSLTSADYFGVGGDTDNLTQVVFDVYDKYAPEPAAYGPEDFGWLKVNIDAASEEVFSVEQQWVDVP